MKTRHTCSHRKELLSLLRSHVTELITQHKLDCWRRDQDTLILLRKMKHLSWLATIRPCATVMYLRVKWIMNWACEYCAPILRGKKGQFQWSVSTVGQLWAPFAWPQELIYIPSRMDMVSTGPTVCASTAVLWAQTFQSDMHAGECHRLRSTETALQLTLCTDTITCTVHTVSYSLSTATMANKLLNHPESIKAIGV